MRTVVLQSYGLCGWAPGRKLSSQEDSPHEMPTVACPPSPPLGCLPAAPHTQPTPERGRRPRLSSPSSTPGPNGEPPTSTTKPPVSTPDFTYDVEKNLRALRELQVFEISAVVESSSPEQKNCYGGPPCVWELAHFTQTALAAVADTEADARLESDGTCYRTDDENLKALQSLRGVAIGDLVLEKPESFDNCYHPSLEPTSSHESRAALRKP